MGLLVSTCNRPGPRRPTNLVKLKTPRGTDMCKKKNRLGDKGMVMGIGGQKSSVGESITPWSFHNFTLFVLYCNDETDTIYSDTTPLG